MKKITLTLLAVLGLTAAVSAQETETTTTTTTTQETPAKKTKYLNFYVGFGINVLGDYNLSDKLAASGVPQIASSAPEVTFGFVMEDEGKYYQDVEASVAYMDDRNGTDRMKTIVSSFRLRPQYKLIDTKSLFFSAGLDIGFTQTNLNLYSRGNTIDLNNLNPATHTGHISMRNGQFILGPSVAVMLFKKSFPLRVNAGYNIGLSNGKWKSDVAEITNTVKENGLGSFYAKLSIGF